MTKTVKQLYPQSMQSVPLRGLYLRHARLVQENTGQPMVYANFLTSMDGRIALKTHNSNYFELPAHLKSEEDFLLLLELYAHADCIITHGGYMRSLAAGRLGNILQLPYTNETQYIHDWRKQQGLKPNPDVIIASGSLDFPWHDSLDSSGQQVIIASGGSASSQKRLEWIDKGRSIFQCGDEKFVDVNILISQLQALGYRSVCLMAGPDLLQDMLQQGYVKHFFMTMPHQLLGGESFMTLLSGGVLKNAGHLTLEALYMDEQNSNSIGQWYVEFSLG